MVARSPMGTVVGDERKEPHDRYGDIAASNERGGTFIRSDEHVLS